MPALWQSSDKERWQAQLDGYWGAVKGCSTGKKSELLELDRQVVGLRWISCWLEPCCSNNSCCSSCHWTAAQLQCLRCPTCRWYFEQLPPLLRSRGKQPYLTKEELVKLVRPV